MEELKEQVKEGEMPLESYTWMHKGAVLTQEEKNKLIDWANSVMDKLKTQYPVDSLVRKKPS
jgi:predicted transcriptional regulator